MAAIDDGHGTDEAATATARWMWGRLEAVHTLHYFAPNVIAAHAALGFEDRNVSYTASRSAPFGPVGPDLVTATFYGFSPELIAAALPAAWSVASPAVVLETSLDALGALLGELWEGEQRNVARTAELLREVALLHPVLGRPLAAVWSSVAWHDDAAVRLWQASTIIRESRGDGHVACLVEAQLDGVEAHLIHRGDGEKLRRILGALRGYVEADWDAAVDRLARRGLLSAVGGLTGSGVALRDHLESRTDALAAPPWGAIGEGAVEELRTTMQPLVTRILDSGILPGIVVREATD